jgi:hypothetical protein
MSTQLIQKYYAEIDKIIRYGGSRNEEPLRKPFQDLLEQYARTKGLVLVAEVEMESKRGTRIRPDGVLKGALRQDMNMNVPFSNLTSCRTIHVRAKYLLWVHWLLSRMWKSQEFASEPRFLQAFSLPHHA